MGDQPQISRIERMKSQNITPPLPPNPVPHIISRFIEIGMVTNTGNGPAPLTWAEIEAWQRQTNIAQPPWEARLMRALSVAYVGEKGRAESENCPPPWHSEVTAAERSADEAALDKLFG